MSIMEMNGASTKTIYLIRHGQSTFNAAYINGVDPFLFDARLSELGQQQANDLAKHVDSLKAELVVSSPLSRALDTTRRGFTEYLKKNTHVKVEVITHHSEFVQTSDDNGRHISDVKKDYPEFQMDHIQERWWSGIPDHLRLDMTIDYTEYFKTPGYKETSVELYQRIDLFKNWLLSRQENVIAVVGHSDFYYHLFEKKLPYFKNCQIVKWNIHTNDAEYVTH